MRTIVFSFAFLIMFFTVYGYQFINVARDIQKDVETIKQSLPEDIQNLPTEQLQQLLEAQLKTNKVENVDAEVKRILEEINKENPEVLNPQLQKYLETIKTRKELNPYDILNFDFKKYFAVEIRRMEKYNEQFINIMLLVAGIIFLSMVINRHNFLSGISYFLASMGFTLSRLFIFLSAVFGVLVWLGLKYNIFINLSSIFLWSPFLLMIMSAISLKIYDFNNPIWNRMFYSLFWPLASGIIMHIF